MQGGKEKAMKQDVRKWRKGIGERRQGMRIKKDMFKKGKLPEKGIE